MLRRRLIGPTLVTLALAGLTGCGDDDPDEGGLAAGDTTTSTSESSSTTGSTTTSVPATSTTATAPAGDGFDGSTTPTSAPAPAGADVALLTDVQVGGEDGVDQVTFTFEESIPGYDVAYIEPPVRQDGSGDEVEVEGAAFLEIRFEPASGFDLFETLEPTYTGPSEVRGDTEVVTEVVRTGDFEANLTWVVGVDDEVPYHIEADEATSTVTVELAAG